MAPVAVHRDVGMKRAHCVAPALRQKPRIAPAAFWLLVIRPSPINIAISRNHIEIAGQHHRHASAGRKRRLVKAKLSCSPGEPGIGKSRLTAALLERLAPEPHTRLRYFCSPQHTDSVLYPIISQMELAAGLPTAATKTRQAR
jgi:hypothetical protein